MHDCDWIFQYILDNGSTRKVQKLKAHKKMYGQDNTIGDRRE